MHGTRRINRLTMRPWKICLITILVVAIKALSNEVHMKWNLWFFIERVAKLFNVYFGLTLI